jgi:hypothetical protein
MFIFVIFFCFMCNFNGRLLQRNFFQHSLFIFIKGNLQTLAQEINPWAAHTSCSWRVNSCRRQVIRQKRPTEMLFCQRCKGSQVCESKDVSSTVQSYVPRMPWNPTPFCRTKKSVSNCVCYDAALFTIRVSEMKNWLEWNVPFSI